MEHAVEKTKEAGGKVGGAAAARGAQALEAGLPPLLQLQQQAGNQAVQELLRQGVIRAKLSVSHPDDPEEQEADSVAGRIMRSHAGSAVAAPCSCGSSGEMCEECQRKPTGTIARKPARPGAPAVPHKAVENILRSPGRPMDAVTRAFFEPRFGRDFSHVRVHTGEEAQRASAGIHAHAFTLGQAIYFAAGQYSPETDTGRKLLAHELTHTVQQQTAGDGRSAVARRQVEIGAAQDGMEVEANSSASAIMHGETKPLIESERQRPAIQRQPDGGQDGGVPDASATPTPASDRDLDAGAPPPSDTAAEGDRSLPFRGMSLTVDPTQIRAQLEGYLQDWGLETYQQLEPAFESELERARFENSPAYLSDVSGVPDWIETNRRRLALMEQIAPSFREQWTSLLREANEFIAVFDVQAHAVLDEMLTTSEDRILAERERYGLNVTYTERTSTRRGPGGEPAEVTTYDPHYSMAANAGTRGMAAAAAGLVEKVREVRRRMDQRNSLMPISYGESAPSEDEMARYNAADQRVQAAAREYNVARFQAESDYPILAAYTPLDTSGTYYVDQTIERLSLAARGSSTQLAGTLYNETAEKLANIDRVYRAVAEGDLSVWKLPSVVGLTRERVQMLAPAVQGKLVDDKVEAAQSEGEILHIALGVLAIALGALAAIPTGGSSLAAGVAFAAGVGSAAVSSYFAIEHLQQYMLDEAANGTDFDKARAVSQTEPSLFWLAVDIVGAIADIHAAAAAFRTLSTTLREATELRRLAQQGQRVAEAEDAMRRLAEQGDQYAPGLGRRLTQAVTEKGGALEREAAITAWEGSLSPTSRAYLVDNPELRAIYHDMDDEMRWLCTHCSDDCLIKGISRAQVARIRAALQRVGPEEVERMRIYLHVRKNEIAEAVADLDRVADEKGLRALLDRTLTETANPPTAPILSGGAATVARNSPGLASGGEYLPVAGRTWLRETGGSAGMIPGQVAARLRNRTFASFDEFQEAFWREVAADPELAAGFEAQNRTLMARGEAPFALQEEQWGGAAGGRFVLHHIVPIEHGGGVYDMSNLLVTSPRLHSGVIHRPTAPMAPFRQLPPE